MKKSEFTASDPIILALDTSSKATSIAVARGAELLKSVTSTDAEKRSERLWNDISSLLGETGLSIREVDLFAVCVGPGGFTGVRVGMAAVKGFAAAASKPIVGVTSLEAAAFAAATSMPVCALVNAYKGEVYWQLFLEKDGLPAPQSEPMVARPEEVLERIVDLDELVFAADSSEAFIESAASRKGKWSIARLDPCRAEAIARLASLKNSRGELNTAEGLKACYVRPAEAEIKLSLGLLGTKIKRSMKSD